MTVFGLTEQVHRCWSSLSDLDHTTVAAWEKSFKYPNAEQMPVRLSTQALEPILNQNRDFIAMADHDLSFVHTEIGIPHFFVVTDPNGIAIHFIGQAEIIEKVRGHNVDAGTPFAFEHAGINGISLAMRMQSTVVVQGVQHTMRFLKDWTCICSPVRLFDEIYGYVDLSFGTDVDVTFAVPLLNKTIEEVESKLKKSRQSISMEAAADLVFEPFNLSNREKEVAFGWLQNKSVLQMAHTMGITEGTVRNMLKKVYAKTGVCDKGQFFRKFLV
jgi:transcriptional regulator of acetoin/glycerol metabolism